MTAWTDRHGHTHVLSRDAVERHLHDAKRLAARYALGGAGLKASERDSGWDQADAHTLAAAHAREAARFAEILVLIDAGDAQIPRRLCPGRND